MLRDKNVMATVAVHKLAKSLPFYEKAIGLMPIDESQRDFGVIGLRGRIDHRSALRVGVRWHQQGHGPDLGPG